MEIIIGLIVIAAAGYFVFFRKKDEPLVVSAPYKVEDTPAPAVEPAAVVVVENAVVEPAILPAGTEASIVAPAKKPRATKTASAKPAVKKATPAKKVAAKKPAARTATSKKA